MGLVACCARVILAARAELFGATLWTKVVWCASYSYRHPRCAYIETELYKHTRVCVLGHCRIVHPFSRVIYVYLYVYVYLEAVMNAVASWPPRDLSGPIDTLMAPDPLRFDLLAASNK